MLHTAICIFLPRLKDLFPRCWMIDLRDQSSQLIVLCWEVTSPKEKYSSWSHHWLNVECKCLASLPCRGATLMGQSSFKGPVDSAEGLLWLHYGPVSTLSIFTLFISMQIYCNIFRSTHQLTSYILISVFLEMQTAAKQGCQNLLHIFIRRHPIRVIRSSQYIYRGLLIFSDKQIQI